MRLEMAILYRQSIEKQRQLLNTRVSVVNSLLDSLLSEYYTTEPDPSSDYLGGDPSETFIKNFTTPTKNILQTSLTEADTQVEQLLADLNDTIASQS